MASILTSEDYNAVKYLTVTAGTVLWIALFSGSSTGCIDVECSSQQIKWRGHGEAFIYQDCMTEGIVYNSASGRCATLEEGKES